MTQKIEVVEKKLLVIDGIEYNIIKQFFVPQIGWELDYLAYIVEYEGKRRLVYSDHGDLRIKDQDMVPKAGQEHFSEDVKGPRDQNWVIVQIQQLENRISDFKEALDFLQGAELKGEE